jgi:hypothetical protein
VAGYAKRTVRLDFPEFTEEGADPVYVEIRNPKTLPFHLIARRDVTDADREANPAADLFAGYDVISRVVVKWHVYDATSNDEEQPLLGLPATEDSVSRLPQRIADAIATLLVEAQNPGAGA